MIQSKLIMPLHDIHEYRCIKVNIIKDIKLSISNYLFL